MIVYYYTIYRFYNLRSLSLVLYNPLPKVPRLWYAEDHQGKYISYLIIYLNISISIWLFIFWLYAGGIDHWWRPGIIAYTHFSQGDPIATRGTRRCSGKFKGSEKYNWRNYKSREDFWRNKNWRRRKVHIRTFIFFFFFFRLLPLRFLSFNLVYCSINQIAASPAWHCIPSYHIPL